MNYDATCQSAGAIVNCDCDTCSGYVWHCPECGATHQSDSPTCYNCAWVNPEDAERLMEEWISMCEFEDAAHCWLATKSANAALEKKLLEINKSGGEILMCQLKEVARIAFVAGLEANQS